MPKASKLRTTFRLGQKTATSYRQLLDGSGGAVCLSAFATRLLLDPEVMAWVAGHTGKIIPIHLEQTFTIHEPLFADVPYEAELSVTQTHAESWLVSAVLWREDNVKVLEMQSRFMAHDANGGIRV